MSNQELSDFTTTYTCGEENFKNGLLLAYGDKDADYKKYINANDNMDSCDQNGYLLIGKNNTKDNIINLYRGMVLDNICEYKNNYHLYDIENEEFKIYQYGTDHDKQQYLNPTNNNERAIVDLIISGQLSNEEIQKLDKKFSYY